MLLRGVLALVCVCWLPVTVRFFINLGRLRTLVRLDPPRPAAWPRVSLVVAARDEGESVGEALRSKLASDYPDLEVVFIDDRSTDATSAAALEIASTDCRLKVVRVDELPPDWLGKVHALARGVEHATGEWLLFSDADVHMEPDALSRAVALCEADGTDMLALVPEYETSSVLLTAVWSTFMRALMVMLDPLAIRDLRKKAVIGSGAFNLVRRSAFDRTPGFEWLRLETGDDVALAMMVKRAGGSVELADGRGAARVDIYPHVAGFFRGIEKNGGTTASHPWAFSAFLLLMQAFEWAPAVAVLVGPAWLRALGALAYACIAAQNIAGLRRNTGKWAEGLLWQAGSMLFAAGMLRSTWLTVIRGGVVWRGTFYPLAKIAEARRFQI